jgi:hypothetical protein
VARDAAIRLMTRRARTGLGFRFQRVSRRETSAVNTRRKGIGKAQCRRQRGDRLAVTARAELLAMTALTSFARRRRPYTMLAHPVSIVCEMRLRQRRRVLEILVTRAAHARVARRLLIVTLEARGHRRPQIAIAFRDSDMTAHAVAARRFGVLFMIEAQMFACLCQLCERAGFGVATEAWPRVVWLRVT